jgi:hypothetical protein
MMKWGHLAPARSAFGQIAFTTDRDGNREIYVMNVDGSTQTNLTNNPAFDFEPDWQPVPCELGKEWDLIANLKPGAPDLRDDNQLFLNPRWR